MKRVENTKAFNDGFEAFTKGVRLSKHPYTDTLIDFDNVILWDCGWFDAMWESTTAPSGI